MNNTVIGNAPLMSQSEWDGYMNSEENEEIEVLAIVSYRKVIKIIPTEKEHDIDSLSLDIFQQEKLPKEKDGWQLEDIEVYEE